MSARCKRAEELEIKNCHEKYEGEEDYCLFHKKNKTQKEAENFYEELIDEKARAKEKEGYVFEDGNFNGYIFPKLERLEDGLSPPGIQIFVSSEFEDVANFFEAIFKYEIWFVDTTFNKGVSFRKATFKQGVDFEDSIFNDKRDVIDEEKEINFIRTTFKGNSKFDSVNFEEQVNFRHATFSKETIFYKVSFKDTVNFEQVDFESPVYFLETKFNKETYFISTTFHKLCDFRETRFSNDVSFKKALFLCEEETIKGGFEYTYLISPSLSKEINFRGGDRSGGRKYKGIAEFNGTIFEETANFKNVNFKNQTIFEDTTFRREAKFNYVEFKKEISFLGTTFEKRATFERSIFADKLNFNYCHFYLGGQINPFLQKILVEDDEESRIKILDYEERAPESFKKSVKTKNRFGTKQAKKSAFRVQRVTFENQGKEEKADEMFVEEMRLRREIKKESYDLLSENIFKKIWYTFLEKPIIDGTCEYGTNPLNIIFVFFHVIFQFSLAYLFGSEYTNASIPSLEGVSILTHPVSSFLEALYYSTVTFTTLGGESATGFLKGVTALQSIYGAVLMALLIAVFARKWMRK